MQLWGNRASLSAVFRSHISTFTYLKYRNYEQLGNQRFKVVIIWQTILYVCLLTSEDCSPATAMYFDPSACKSDTHQFVNPYNKKLCSNKDQYRENKIKNIILEQSLPGKSKNTLSLHNDWSSAHKILKIRVIFFMALKMFAMES